MEFHENYPVDKLIPYARNSRTHNDEQVAQIVASIKEFGFTNPILIGADDVIIAGHGRLLAAQCMGAKRSSGCSFAAFDRNATARVGDCRQQNRSQRRMGRGNARFRDERTWRDGL